MFTSRCFRPVSVSDLNKAISIFVRISLTPACYVYVNSYFRLFVQDSRLIFMVLSLLVVQKVAVSMKTNKFVWFRYCSFLCMLFSFTQIKHETTPGTKFKNVCNGILERLLQVACTLYTFLLPFKILMGCLTLSLQTVQVRYLFWNRHLFKVFLKIWTLFTIIFQCARLYFL